MVLSHSADRLRADPWPRVTLEAPAYPLGMIGGPVPRRRRLLEPRFRYRLEGVLCGITRLSLLRLSLRTRVDPVGHLLPNLLAPCTGRLHRYLGVNPDAQQLFASVPVIALTPPLRPVRIDEHVEVVAVVELVGGIPGFGGTDLRVRQAASGHGG